MKLFVICLFPMMISPYLSATITSPPRAYFHPYVDTQPFTASPFRIKSKTIDITIHQFFVKLQLTWEIEGTTMTDLPYQATITTPAACIPSRFRWQIDGQMVDASRTVFKHARDSFDMAHLNATPVASLTGDEGVFKLSIFPVAKAKPQTVSVDFLLPVANINRQNMFPLVLDPIKDVPLKIRIHQPDRNSPLSLSGDALKDLHQVETATGLLLQGIEKDNYQFKTLKIKWPTQLEPSLLIAKREDKSWLYTMRAPLPELPLSSNTWNPMFSKEVVVLWSKPRNKESQEFKDRLKAFEKLYWRANRILVVFVDQGMALPFVAKASRDIRDLDPMVKRLETFEASDFSWEMPHDYLTDKHLCLLIGDALWPKFLPTVPDNLGAYFYPKQIFPHRASPFFNAQVVWDYRQFDFSGQTAFYAFENNKWRKAKNYFNQPLFAASFVLSHPRVIHRSGPTQLLPFGSMHVDRQQSLAREKPISYLAMGQLEFMPEQFQFAFPGAGYSKIIQSDKAQEVPAKILEEWMIRKSGINLSKRTPNLTSGTQSQVYLWNAKRNIGFLIFKDFESYRSHYVLPSNNFPADKEALRNLELDAQQWPENFQNLNKDILREKTHTGFVQFIPTFNGKPTSYLEFDTIFALGASTSRKQAMDGKVRPVRVKAGTYDIIARSHVLIKVPKVKVVEGEVIEVSLDFKSK